MTQPKGALTCPNCGWSDIRPSIREGAVDWVMKRLFLAPFRCRKCRLRFYRSAGRAVRQMRPVAPIAPVVRVQRVSLAILILDDDPSLRKLFRKLLEKDGHRVREAGSNDDLMREVRSGIPDLVIINLNSEEEKGLQTALALSAAYPATEVIALSDPVAIEKLDAETPINLAILGKPVRPRALLGLVRDLINATRELETA